MKYIYILMIISLVTVISSCNREEQSEPVGETPSVITLDDKQMESAGIETGYMRETTLTSKISCNGNIETPPSNRAKISSLMSGYVKEIFVFDGKYVTKGENIALLENPEFLMMQKEYLTEKSRLDYLEQNYQRQTELNEKNINALKEYQRVKSEWEQSQVSLASLEENLKILGCNTDELSIGNLVSVFSVKAPINGYIEGINIAIGQFVQPAEVITELVNRKEFLIVLRVFEKDIARIMQGQVVSFLCPDPRSMVKEHFGKVIYSGQKIDQISRTFMVYAKPDEDYENLRHGMMIRADIHVEDKDVMTLPVESVVYSDQGEIVFIKDGNSYRPVKIETGITDNERVEIINHQDLEGREIVLKGGVYLLSAIKGAGE